MSNAILSVPLPIPKQVAGDIIKTFQNLGPADNPLGWDRTLIGYVTDIRDAVNNFTNSTWNIAQIEQGMGWIRRYGPLAAADGGMLTTITKVGPGPGHVLILDPNGNPTKVVGNVYMLHGANQPMPSEQWKYSHYGRIGWAYYRKQTLENEIATDRLILTTIPIAVRRTTVGRRQIQLLNDAIARNTNSLVDVRNYIEEFERDLALP